MSYIDYFNINKSYFPVVDLDTIENYPDLWKSFYPHASFIRLLTQICNFLNGKQSQSVWVEGAYGTGKSHAILTAKKILDSDITDVNDYFTKYSKVLDSGLCNTIEKIKNQKILTVHKYGSSNIHSDTDLMLMLQESVLKALKENDASYLGEMSLKDTVLNYLANDDNKGYFNSKVKNTNNIEDADTIIRKLNTITDESNIQSLMSKVLNFCKNELQLNLRLDLDSFKNWVLDIKEKNNYDAIVFFWDEATEYFKTNQTKLSGFQSLVEPGFTNEKFYFVVVTHLVEEIIAADNTDAKKIFDRFQNPRVIINLPDSMAFDLLGAALKMNKLREFEWLSQKSSLENKVSEVSDELAKTLKINKDSFNKIMPIHPYAAIILKNMATGFDANQRSMFSFINNENEHGFIHFIKNHNFDCVEPLLTADKLWDYYFEYGKGSLPEEVKRVLRLYDDKEPYIDNIKNAPDDIKAKLKRLLKTVLLFQSVSLTTKISYLLPTKNNLKYAFEGDDISQQFDAFIAALNNEKIVNILGDKVLVPLSNNTDFVDPVVIDNLKNQLKAEKTTYKLAEEAGCIDGLKFGEKFKHRFEINLNSYKTTNDKALINKIENTNRFGIALFAATFDDKAIVKNKIDNLSKHERILYVDASENALDVNSYNEYIEKSAYARYFSDKNKSESQKYMQEAQDILNKWVRNLETCQYRILTVKGENIVYGLKDLVKTLETWTKSFYPLCLDYLDVSDNLYTASNIPAGVGYGINENGSGVFNNNNLKPNINFKGTYKVDNYWLADPNLHLSKIKIHTDDFIKNKLAAQKEVSIKEIFDMLKEWETGFIPCNITAYVMGFILKEYIDGSYRWSDVSQADELTEEKLKSMIKNLLNNEINPGKYKDEYITFLSDEENAFIDNSIIVFDLEKKHCGSAKNTIKQIRYAVSQFEFPFWCLKENNYSSVENEFIDKYSEILNTYNLTENVSEQQLATEIGNLYIANPAIANSLHVKFNGVNCKAGMKSYINNNYHEIVSLCSSLGVGDEYINILKEKYPKDSDSAWLWDVTTSDDLIKDVKLEYEIIGESNKYNPGAKTFEKMCEAWRIKADDILISNDLIIDENPDFEDIINVLVNIHDDETYLKKNKTDKINFLNALKTHGQDFYDFLNDQKPMFLKVCAGVLAKYPDDIKNKAFDNIKNGINYPLGLSDVEYNNRLQKLLDDTLPKKQDDLKTLWKKYTDTESPSKWSVIYKMSPLAMIPVSEINEFSKCFRCINYPGSFNDTDFEEAINLLNNNSVLIESFKDINVVNQKFRENILREFSSLFSDAEIEDVKTKLNAKNFSPEKWYANPDIIIEVFEIAKNKYNEIGKSKVQNKINNMSDSDLRELVEKLVDKNVRFGVEILK